MPAKITTLCDDIVTFLGTLSLSQTFTASRENVWLDSLEDVTGIEVVVLPQETETLAETRGASGRRYRVNLVGQARLDTDNDKQRQDDVMMLMEEIEDALYNVTMGALAFDTFSESAGSRASFDVTTMAEDRLFRTVLQITYRGD